MVEDKELQQRIQKIGGLVAEIESISDAALRSTAQQLMQTLMELHGAALDRSLEIIVGTGDPGMRIIDEMARDPLVGSVLVLHGLHPDDLETRVVKAVERLQAKLLLEGSRLDLLAYRRRSSPCESYSARACVCFNQQNLALQCGRRDLRSGSRHRIASHRRIGREACVGICFGGVARRPCGRARIGRPNCRGREQAAVCITAYTLTQGECRDDAYQ